MAEQRLEGFRYQAELIERAEEVALVARVRLAACVLRFRRKVNAKWDRVNVLAEPRSAYHLSGPARSEWEHSILRVDSLRYAITFRTMRS